MEVADISDDDDEDEEEEEEEEQDNDNDNGVYSDLQYIAEMIGTAPTPSTPATTATAAAPSAQAAESEESDDDDDEDDEDNEGIDEEKVDENNNNDNNTDSDDSDSDSDEEDVLQTSSKNNKSNKAKKEWEMMTEEEAEALPSGPVRTKHEAAEEEVLAPPVQKISSAEEAQLTHVGEVLYHIEHEHTIVVQAQFTMNPLNEKSVLCNREGLVLGVIHEVFGPVNTPFYIVRYKAPQQQKNANNTNTNNTKANSEKGSKNKRNKQKKDKQSETKEGEAEAEPIAAETSPEEELVDANTAMEEVSMPNEPSVVEESVVQEVSPVQTETAIEAETETVSAPKEEPIDYVRVFSVGSPVYAVPTHATFITPTQIMMWKTKGSDASNAYDEEVCVCLCVCVFVFTFFDFHRLKKKSSIIQTTSKRCSRSRPVSDSNASLRRETPPVVLLVLRRRSSDDVWLLRTTPTASHLASRRSRRALQCMR